MFYGQYIFQYDACAPASLGVAQDLVRSQLLTGVNDLAVASRMHLAGTVWTPQQSPDPTRLRTWVNRKVTDIYPVVIG